MSYVCSFRVLTDVSNEALDLDIHYVVWRQTIHIPQNFVII